MDLVKPIESLLQILAPQSTTINQICTQYEAEAEMSCAVYIVDETPAINLNAQIITALSELNATIDIDIILIE